ncbi:Peroxiredoxin [Evansella caseinilytica]|uniref:Peroxiredoxin n=1 Tax=Evansella caseinilytica TaxID=1503961 RepID=A0A1H3UXN1_9BACI|nr:TlpA family protein disulfide reductase [Evansella caseinilytica]SDZ67117.1 Peroxiredoxin [Evansella caseinilytica]
MDKRRIAQGAILLFIIGVLATFVIGIRAQGNAVGVGDEAVDFALEDMDGQLHQLSDYRGEIVVLNFFASWCKPCEAEAPELIAFHEEFADELIFFSIVKSETKRNVERFVERTGYEKPFLFDFDLTVSKSFGVVGQPETIIIDQNGVIREHIVGPVTRDVLAKKVSELQ